MTPPFELTFYVQQRSSTHRLPSNQSTKVGRGAGVQIRVDDASVSREHLCIHVGDKSVEVEDLGSSNGTRIFRSERPDEGIKLVPHQRYGLASGDLLRLGNIPGLIQRPSSLRASDGATSPPSTARSRILADPEMKRIYDLAERAAASDIGVLILGETGAGKELLASHVHEKSRRSKRNFLQINCAALSETLLESELFGHEKGAFTGAHSTRAGLLESAAGGTVFLDELGEMPLATQAKLLRVLEERQIRRLGSSRNLPIDVRFVAATNRNLEEEITVGRFRRDLYYRISGITLKIPPLRERPVEIETLARHFLHEFCLRSGIAAPDLTTSAMRALREYHWPGNVRELKNAMEAAPFLSGGAPLTEDHIPKSSAAYDPYNDPFPDDELTDVSFVDQSRAVQEAVRAARESRQRQTSTSPQRPVAPPNAYRAPRLPSEVELAGFSSKAAYPEGPRHGANLSASEFPRDGHSSSASGADVGGLTHGNSKDFSPQLEREAVIQALDACSGNQTRAAQMLQVSRRTLINRIEALGLPRPRKRG